MRGEGMKKERKIRPVYTTGKKMNSFVRCLIAHESARQPLKGP